MKKRTLWYVGILAILLVVFLFPACTRKKDIPTIGVSFGVGSAVRWENEKVYMEERAKELGVNIEVRLNKTDEPKTQEEDCLEMIDSGIDVLILTPRDVTKVGSILEYARQKKVPVISYARVVLGDKVDLFVGYDSNRIGQSMGQYATEMVYKGDYILLSGDENDNNAALLYDGATRYVDAIRDDINILLDTPVAGWSPETAKALVKEAIAKNNNQVDVILAPNDKIAGACAEALEELGITDEVIITGMDAELDAARRIVRGTQSSTFYMDLKQLSYTAVEEAVHFAKGEKVTINTTFDNQSGSTIDSNLITGQLVTKENLDRILIESGYFTKEEVYGDTATGK